MSVSIRFLLLSIVCNVSGWGYGQPITIEQKDLTRVEREFELYESDFIYNPETVARLRATVDSLNVKFKTCETKTFLSFPQGKATYVQVKRNVRRAAEAMASGISLEDFKRKFPRAKIRLDSNVVKTHFYLDKKYIYYKQLDEIGESVKSLQGDKTNGWVFDYQDYYKEIRAYYLHDLQSREIPNEYAMMIQYVDCMVDTTGYIFREHGLPDSVLYTLVDGSKVKQFINWAYSFEKSPTLRDPSPDLGDSLWKALLEKYEVDRADWERRWHAWIDREIEKDPALLTLLDEAIEEVKETGIGALPLDMVAEPHLSPEKSLELKRNYVVRGFCSVDTGPRLHAIDICKLAAETHQWDIFLRSHLNLLSDNFERYADGPHGWRTRGTYLPELEALDLNTVDLMIGMSLASENVHPNHYTADTWRVARALRESQHSAQVENLLLLMVRDERLDLYNRIQMAYVYIHYTRGLKEEARRVEGIEKIKDALLSLPVGIRRRFDPLF